MQNTEDMDLCLFYTFYYDKTHIKTKWRESSLCNGSKDVAFGISLGFQNWQHVTEPASYIDVI